MLHDENMRGLSLAQGLLTLIKHRVQAEARLQYLP